MIVQAIDSQIFMSQVSDHKKHDILNSITSLGTYSMRAEGCSISNTDWHLPSNFQRPYWGVVVSSIEKHIVDVINVRKDIQCKFKVDNFWFQQYEQGDYHDWHVHGQSMFSAVYYVELPEDTNTVFKNFDKEFVFDCKEGDIITFPSYLAHRSKPNKSGKRKTVIAFNWSII